MTHDDVEYYLGFLRSDCARSRGPRDSQYVEALGVAMDALGTCGNCEHAEHDMSPLKLVHCTLDGWHYNGKLMTKQSRCERWAQVQP